MDSKTLDEKVSALLLGLPPELSASIRDKVSFYKSKAPVFSFDEIYLEAINLVRLEMLAYLDRRSYLGMYNRRWAEYKIGEHIRSLVMKESREERDLYTLARVNFDLNGLKALNDLGGHEAGNKGLKLFANILNFGATTIWLRDELGLKVTSSAEGGDEFGLLATGPIDLRSHVEEIVKRYTDEVYAADASYMLNFKSPEVLEKLSMLGIADEIPEDFAFHLSTSVGVCLLGEAFDRVDVSRPGVSFNEIVSDLTNATFKIADERGAAHKSAFKAELAKTDPVLSGLYSRMSKEVIHLERELRKRDTKIAELEGKLKR